MKPSKFDYYAPQSLQEALELLARFADEGKPLAGGQSLIPLMAFRLAVFGQLIDLNGIRELGGVRTDDGQLVIGGLTRQCVLEHDAEVARLAPLVPEATRLIGHFQIRNRGTIGGSLAHADPAAEYPAVTVALDATIEIASSGGTRAVAAEELFDSAYETTLEPEELIVAVRIPVRAAGEGFAIREVTRRMGDFALAGCAAKVAVDGAGSVAAARVALFGVAGRPVRLTVAEEALVGSRNGGPDLAAVLEQATSDVEPLQDASATSEYRKKVARHIARVTIEEAMTRARQGAAQG
jgi:aerobic carbon-monoxide dehydrogenase medium subunit